MWGEGLWPTPPPLPPAQLTYRQTGDVRGSPSYEEGGATLYFYSFAFLQDDSYTMETACIL